MYHLLAALAALGSAAGKPDHRHHNEKSALLAPVRTHDRTTFAHTHCRTLSHQSCASMRCGWLSSLICRIMCTGLPTNNTTHHAPHTTLNLHTGRSEAAARPQPDGHAGIHRGCGRDGPARLGGLCFRLHLGLGTKREGKKWGWGWGWMMGAGHVSQESGRAGERRALLCADMAV